MEVQIVKIYTVNFVTYNDTMSFMASEELNKGDYVICESPRGNELAIVTSEGKDYDVNIADQLSFIKKKADENDLLIHKANIDECKKILPDIQKECDKLNLNMKIVSCNYTFDRTKLMLTYLSDERVDFRELLKVLASIYHARIDLRQIGARDKAKLIGGVGICGLPLCCATFLNEFDGISITMAKNQLLALNIPKLSGQCGKLICCLKYEDAIYVEERKSMPKIGVKIKYEGNIYKITSINVLTKIVRLESSENIINVPLENIKNAEIIVPQNTNFKKSKNVKE